MCAFECTPSQGCFDVCVLLLVSVSQSPGLVVVASLQCVLACTHACLSVCACMFLHATICETRNCSDYPVRQQVK